MNLFNNSMLYKLLYTIFKNTRYKQEWKKYVPKKIVDGKEIPSTTLYEDGLMRKTLDKKRYIVYDGGINFMGYVNLDGTLTYNGEPDDYKESFLLSAKDNIINMK